MSVPNSLPIGISNGNDVIDYIKQTLHFSNGELCPPLVIYILEMRLSYPRF